MTNREAVNLRAARIGGMRTAVFKLAALVLLVPLLLAYSKFGLPIAVVAFILMFSAVIVGVDAICFSRLVRCSRCDGALWRYLAHGPRGRRLRLREDISVCPLCGLDLSQPTERRHGDLARP
jgi:hypothetical protein